MFVDLVQFLYSLFGFHFLLLSYHSVLLMMTIFPALNLNSRLETGVCMCFEGL